MFPVHTVNICDSYFDPQIKMNVSPPVPTSETSITDGVYATLLSSVLGVSVLILCLSRFSSGVPIFGKDVAKLRRFWRHNSDVLDTDLFREIKYARPERVPEWSFRMSLLLNVALLTLVVCHAVILTIECPTSLRTVYVIYCVFTPYYHRSNLG